MNQETIKQAYKDAGVTKTAEIIQGVQKAIQVVENRIDTAFETMAPAVATEATKEDRKLLRAQTNFLKHLEGR